MSERLTQARSAITGARLDARAHKDGALCDIVYSLVDALEALCDEVESQDSIIRQHDRILRIDA